MTTATEIDSRLKTPEGALADGARPSPDESAMMLNVLSVVQREPKVTQRRLSSELGIALGLANAILKRCVRHGLIKISQAPFNRYSYYLTPTGFAEKSRLTVQHLRYSFNLFRDARNQYFELLAPLVASGTGRIVVLGASELAEAAVLSARETGASIVAVSDASFAGEYHVGVPVIRDFATFADRADALVLADMKSPQAVFDDAMARGPRAGFAVANILAPALLGVSREAARAEPGAAP